MLIIIGIGIACLTDLANLQKQNKLEKVEATILYYIIDIETRKLYNGILKFNLIYSKKYV